ncbi:hypothetical protein [Nocardiopsis sp. NRRL B-16309]|uniref:hypothetical protein n=1 Tax=Nocardiopsis sp. NRRL B-16309 TaxID=1519494 RepID=UPI0006B04135|nr:hypothetical protein [Nocardiopsis sp. NRRL B-16309]KOX10128.1 hypothetical protein ADL05_25950 [Nocardiopsis sp. NRRL B-16309]
MTNPETEVRQAIADYDADIAHIEELTEQAIQRRDQRLRDIHARAGWKQVNLINATGYTRETIRQALNPEIREAIKARRAAKKKETGS